MPCHSGINAEFRRECALGSGNLQNDGLIPFGGFVVKNVNSNHVSCACDIEGCRNAEVLSLDRTAHAFVNIDVDFQGGGRHRTNRDGNLNRRVFLVDFGRARTLRRKADFCRVIVKEGDIVRHWSNTPSERQRPFGKTDREGLVGFDARVIGICNSQLRELRLRR